MPTRRPLSLERSATSVSNSTEPLDCTSPAAFLLAAGEIRSMRPSNSSSPVASDLMTADIPSLTEPMSNSLTLVLTTRSSVFSITNRSPLPWPPSFA